MFGLVLIGFLQSCLVQTPTDTIDRLISNLRSASADVRAQAAKHLEDHGVEATRAVPELIRCLGDKSTPVRIAVIGALTRIQNPRAVQRLIRVLESDPNDEVRLGAAIAFANIGPEAHQAIPTLINVMKAELEKENDAFVAELGHAAASGLLGMGRLAVPALNDVLGDARTNSNACVVAATTLGQIAYSDPEGAKPAIPVLVRLLDRKDDKLIWQAAEALGTMGQLAKDAVPPLLRLAKAGSANAKVIAASALYRIDPGNVVTVPTLIQGLSSEDC